MKSQITNHIGQFSVFSSQFSVCVDWLMEQFLKIGSLYSEWKMKIYTQRGN